MLKNIILILIILFLLNCIKIKTSVVNENFTSKKSSIFNQDTFARNPIINNNIPDKDLYFGKDQYITKPDHNNTKLYYQDIQVLKNTNDLYFNYDNNFDNRNLAMKLNDKKIINTPISNQELIDKFNYETNNGVVGKSLYNIEYPTEFVSPTANTTPLIDQKILYDHRFLDMNKEDLENMIHNYDNKDTYDKDIKDIYDDMIFDYKNINKKKTPTNKDIKIDGAFSESTVPINQWFYDEDNTNELSFDPMQSLELSVQ